jgi:hypothetical protein
MNLLPIILHHRQGAPLIQVSSSYLTPRKEKENKNLYSIGVQLRARPKMSSNKDGIAFVHNVCGHMLAAFFFDVDINSLYNDYCSHQQSNIPREQLEKHCFALVDASASCFMPIAIKFLYFTFVEWGHFLNSKEPISDIVFDSHDMHQVTLLAENLSNKRVANDFIERIRRYQTIQKVQDKLNTICKKLPPAKLKQIAKDRSLVSLCSCDYVRNKINEKALSYLTPTSLAKKFQERFTAPCYNFSNIFYDPNDDSLGQARKIEASALCLPINIVDKNVKTYYPELLIILRRWDKRNSEVLLKKQ